MDKRVALMMVVVVASIGAALAWRSTRPPAPVVPPPPEPPEIRSLVVLLSQPPQFDKTVVAKAIASEFGAAAKVTGDLPGLTVHTDGHELLLRVQRDQYSLRGYEFELEHLGWIAVDHTNWQGRPEVDSYPLLARVLAALWPESAAAILHPETKEWAMVTRSTPKKLRQPEVLDALFLPDKSAELRNAHTNDPEFAAAREQARRRWPEFVKAFRAHAGQDFIVKAAVRRGKFTERIWINVVSENESGITGRLANEPFDLEGLRLGSTVTVSVSDIDDWRYSVDGQIQGYFTKAAVEARK